VPAPLSEELRKLNGQKEFLRNLPKRNIDADIEVSDYLKKHPVYISLTTSPKRLSKLTHVLETLDLDHVTHILINLPQEFGRDGSEYDIPAELLKFPKVKIIRTPVDYGPITKLIPGIEYARKKDKDSLVITIDDDVGYPSGMVSELIYNSVKYKNSVITGSGQDSKFWDLGAGSPSRGLPSIGKNTGNNCSNTDPTSYCDVVEGFGSIAYRAGQVDTDMMLKLADKGFSRDCFASDDLIISFALAISGVQKIKVRNDYLHVDTLIPFDYGFDEDALHRGAGLEGDTFKNPGQVNDQKYQNCFKQLVDIAYDSTKGQYKSRNKIMAALSKRTAPRLDPVDSALALTSTATSALGHLAGSTSSCP
jgi:hypothetical protein